jgi:predicted glutamate--cysteine ligase
LIQLAADNESAVAKDSLEAEVIDWQTGERSTASELIQKRYEQYLPIAASHGFEEQLARIPTLLREGNLAQRWLARHAQGMTVREVIQQAIGELAELDNAYDPQCPQVIF